MINNHYLVGMSKTFNTLVPNHSSQASILPTKILFYIADNEGCTSRAIRNEFEVNQSSISRATGILRGSYIRGKTSRPGKRALIRHYDVGRNTFRYELTELGYRVVSRALSPMIKAASKVLANSI